MPYDPPHKCFMQRLKKEDLKEPSTKYVFYDYECTIDDGEHHPALIVAMYFAHDQPEVFFDNESFCKWIFQKKHKGYTFVAHNGGRYDFHFIRQYMIKNHVQSSDLINGNTVMYSFATDWKIRFVDSYRFLPMSLRKFPKTFGIKSKSKGYFPYRFFTQMRINYQGKMPDLEWFDFGLLSEKEQVDAVQWHEQNRNTQVNLLKMCTRYCKDDVELLKAGCIKFRNELMRISNNEIDPFQYVTIASVCHTMYRRIFMPPQSIAILQQAGCMQAERSIWLSSKEEQVREGRLQPIEDQVFGRCYVDESIDRLYVFMHCADIGCMTCYQRFTNHPTTFQPMHSIARTFNKYVKETSDLMAMDIHVTKLCEWRKEQGLYQDDLKGIRQYMKMDLRDGFYGGRTEAIALEATIPDSEEGKFVDFTSLYPSVQSGIFNGITRDTEGTTRPYTTRSVILCISQRTLVILVITLV